MKKCPYENNPCKVVNCKFVRDGNPDHCGLYTFLDTVNKELKSAKKEDRELINDLKERYVKVWNEHTESRGKGRATGTMFEKWIRERIRDRLGGEEIERGKVSFKFGKFNVDAAIPSTRQAKVILEIKIHTDIQHTLALGGLLKSSPEDRKLGFVTLNEPKKEEVKKILNDFKESYKNRFDYFIIAGKDGWSHSIDRLKEFCRT